LTRPPSQTSHPVNTNAIAQTFGFAWEYTRPFQT
jgi:hypothetical protein